MADPFPALQRFQSLVLADAALQHELRQTSSHAGFVALVAQRARERGCALSAAEVEEALVAAARCWMLRRIR
jgi:hypothetical protein